MAQRNKPNKKQKVSSKPSPNVGLPSNKPTELSNFLNWKLLDKYAWYLIGILTIIGFGLRVSRVDFLTLWVDEYIHVMRARDFLLYGTSLLKGENNGVILTFFIVPLFKLFSIDEFWARFPNVIFGTLSIPLIFYVGRMLFNAPIGFIAAFISTFSWYAIHWSRMARNYACFEFAYLLLIIVFFKAWELRKQNPEGEGFFDKWGFDKKHLLWLLPALLYAFLNHQLTFFFAFSAGTYASVIAANNIVKKRPSAFLSKYSIILYPFAAIAAVMFMPFLGDLISPILLLFLPQKAVTWVIPNWEFIGNMFNDPEKRYISFDLYNGVLQTDLPYLHYLGYAGFILAFFINRKSALFISSFFIIPFFLMSFVFRDPALPRYLLYITPFFLIAVASAIYFLWNNILSRAVAQSLQSKLITKVAVYGLTLWLVFIDLPFKEAQAYINTEVHGMVTPKTLSHWSFVDWKYPSRYVGQYMKEGDLILSTVPKPTDFYLGINSSQRFRQRHFDTKIRQYVMNDEPETNELHARTTNGFINAVNSTQRGWLLADYYFYNALTDPQARQWAIQNLEFHYDASKDAGVHVFSWDKSLPPSPQKNVLIVLGKGGKNASQELTMDIQNLNAANKVRLFFDVEAIDHNQEAILVVNGKNSVYLPKPNTNGRETIYIDLDKNWFKPQGNKFQFGYNEQKVKGLSGNIDFRKGFAVYNMNALPI